MFHKITQWCLFKYFSYEGIMSVTTDDLQKEIEKLKIQNEQIETDFGQKRAMFMEMYKQKEGNKSYLLNSL